MVNNLTYLDHEKYNSKCRRRNKEHSSPTLHWNAFTCDSNCTNIAAAAGANYIYTSNDSGVTSTQQVNVTKQDWKSVASSRDGTKLVAVAKSSFIFTSSDGGMVWTNQTKSSAQAWSSVACDINCTNIVAVVENGFIHTSNDSGVTWTERYVNAGWTAVASSADGSKLIAAAGQGNGPHDGYIYLSNDSGVTWTLVY
jgi:photosystem II stability/assembly factor-like uncharacterized protein